MRHYTSYFPGNWRLRCDYLLGTRAAGLILYGVLPSSLAALGALKVPHFQAQLLPMVAVVPFAVLFLLIRQRLKAWYLMTYALVIRSAVLTLVIIVLSTGVFFAAALIKTSDTQDWSFLTTAQRYTLLQQSFLLALVALVAASTLFLTALKDKSSLPGLPSAKFLTALALLRGTMAKILKAEIWKDAEGAKSEELKTRIEAARDSLGELTARSAAKSGRGRFFRRLCQDLENLETARGQVAVAATRWQDLFGSTPAEELSSDDKSLRSSLQSLQGLRIDV